MYSKHAEFKAGIVVLAALVVLVFLLYFAGGSEPFWADYRYVEVRFAQGDVAPNAGDAVYLNGSKIGRVHSVGQREERRGAGAATPLTPEDRRRLKLQPGQDGLVRELYVLAVLKLPADQLIPVGTRARISKSLTGIRDLALLPGISEDNLSDEQIRSSPLPGSETPGLEDIAQRVNALVDTISGVVGQGGDVMVEARTMLQLLTEKIDALNTAELDKELQAAVSSLRRTLEGVETRFDSIASNIDAASADVKRITETGVGTIDDLRADLKEVFVTIKEVVRKLDLIVADAKAPIDSFLADMATTGRNLKDLSTEFNGLGPQAQEVLRDLGVDTKLFLATLNDTAHNLLDASEDLRAHPWKLLNKPENEEIAYENLRSAALNYTRTARDVNEASARLKGLLARNDIEDPDVKLLVEAALSDFRGSLENYKSAERRWLALFQAADPARRGAPPPGGPRKR